MQNWENILMWSVYDLSEYLLIEQLNESISYVSLFTEKKYIVHYA